MAWLPAASTTVAPARSDMARWAGGDHPILGRDQVPARLGPPGGGGDRSAQGVHPQGTWASAMNAACPPGRSAANEPYNFSRSRSRKPSLGGRIGGTGAPGGGSAIRVLTDSPLSGAQPGLPPRTSSSTLRPCLAWLESPPSGRGDHCRLAEDSL